MRKYLFPLILILAVATVSGEVYHQIDAGKEAVRMNTTVELECDSQCPVSSWSLTWSVPEDAAVRNVTAKNGEVTDYSVRGDTLSIQTKSNVPSDTETIGIVMFIDRPAEQIHDGLYKREFSLPSFSGTGTSGSVEVDNLLSGRMSYGFDTVYRNDTMEFTGKGPSILRVKFGEGDATDYFVFFGATRNNMEDAYEIPLGVTGNEQGFPRFPVAVLPDGKYNETLNRWSAGEYFNGVIRLRESLDEEFKPVLAHEVVHGLNDRVLNWDSTSSSYFDEGTSRYVDYLVRKKMYNTGETDKPPRELFGDPVKYDPDPNDRYYQSLPPRGDKDVLWNYYQQDRDFMKQWSPSESPAEVRGFGYAYSELIIRNYVANNNSLRDLYENVDPQREVESNQEKWGIYSEQLDMTPCKYETRERFEACLERINEYDYPVYRAEPSRQQQELDIDRIKVPTRKQPERNFGNLSLGGNASEIASNANQGFNVLIDRLLKFLRSILS